MRSPDSSLIAATSVRAYFHEAFTAATRNQDVAVDDMTAAYVINLLTTYVRTSALAAVSDEGRHHRALALLYADALDTEQAEQRNQALQRLGDIALFIAGIFTDSLNRKLVDVGYYIDMGETAYTTLHVAMQQRSDPFARSELFEQLGANFATLVDVLAEISEQSGLNSNADVLRTYEIWQRSGSARAARQLRRFGIETLTAGRRHSTH